MGHERSLTARGAGANRVFGFTLIEMAIMLTIFGVLLLGGVEAIRAQTAKRKMEQGQAAVQEIQRALLGFVTAYGRLPYAANPASGTGVEEAARTFGLLPWNSLGVKPVDPWGHAYTYHVTGGYAVEGTFMTTSGSLVVRNAGDTADMVTDLPVVVVSHGPNGKGAYLTNGSQLSTTAATPMDTENLDGDVNYRLGGDDILLWISEDVLKYQKGTYVPP
ncbi:MAG: type II secretion system GspH family protein [Magnetococcus sp. XQGC-1]